MPQHLRAGFTLLEVLVAISIMSVIGMFTWQTIASTTTVRVVLEHDRSRTRKA